MKLFLLFCVLIPLIFQGQNKTANISLSLSSIQVKDSSYPVKIVVKNLDGWDTVINTIDSLIKFEIPVIEPIYGEVELYSKNGEYIAFTGSILFKNDKFKISSSSTPGLLLVEGGETEFIKNNIHLLFEVPNSLYNILIKNKISIRADTVIKTIDSLFHPYYTEYVNNSLNVVRNYSNYYFVLDKLYNNRYFFTVGVLEKMLNTFSSDIKLTLQWQKFLTYIRNEKKLLNNNFIPEINIETAYGTRTTENSILDKNKFTFIDFWASWCTPCIAAMKDLTTIYPLIDTSKVKIISISIDKDKRAWLKANTIEFVKWPSYIDISENVFNTFNISYIPDGVLLDKEGRIIKRSVHVDTFIKFLNDNKLLKE